MSDADVLRRVLADACSRIVAALEAVDIDDVQHARTLLSDLAFDLSRESRRPIVSCPSCPATFRWPGERDEHVDRTHPEVEW